MKLQNLAIIFLVIAIPLIAILSYYLNLQKKTLNMQAEYDKKLYEATKEGVEAFEINTVEWEAQNTNRENVLASINAFMTSLANNLNIPGTAREYIQNYIPAIAFIDYDGYYTYAPAFVPVTAEDEDGLQLFLNTTTGKIEKNEGEILYVAESGGASYKYEYSEFVNDKLVDKEKIYKNLTTDIAKAKKEYVHTLNNKISYSSEYKNKTKTTDVIINYTLDNRMYVYGTVDDKSVNKDGYIVYFDDNKTTLPRMYITGYNPNSKYRDDEINVANGRNITKAVYNDVKIDSEILEEQVLYFENNEYRLENFKYIYDVQHEKLYYDERVDNFFLIDNKDKTRQFLNNDTARIGDSDCRYKSISILWGSGDDTTKYKKIYQVLNGVDKGQWCINLDKEKNDGDYYEEVTARIKDGTVIDALGLNNAEFTAIYKDYSAISYYVEAKAFTNWISEILSGELTQKSVELNESNGKYENINKTIAKEKNPFIISEINNPDDITSLFVDHKIEVMKSKIESNLNLSISNYNRNGKENYNFRMPVLRSKDWEQALSNISMITFFQGKQIGLKYYNNYAIATSTSNKAYVDPNQIYISGADNNFHRPYCEKCNDSTYTGYRSIEYIAKEYKTDEEKYYYYQHDNSRDAFSETACYYCVVNKANLVKTDNRDVMEKQEKTYNEALARERYYQKQNITGKLSINVIYHSNLPEAYREAVVKNMPENEIINYGESIKVSTKEPYIETSGDIQLVFTGWIKGNGDDTYNINNDAVADYLLHGGDPINGIGEEDIHLYAVWSSSLTKLTNLEWKKDISWPESINLWDKVSYSNSEIAKSIYDEINNNSRIKKSMISNIEIKDTSIRMIGNCFNAGKGAVWSTYNSEHYDIDSWSFDYKVNMGDSFNAAGFMFDVKESRDSASGKRYLSGYLFSINFPKGSRTEIENEFLEKTKIGSNPKTYNGAIYSFKYVIGANNQNMEVLNLKAQFDISINGSENKNKTNEGRITIKVKPDGGYKIFGTGISGIDIPKQYNCSNSFGFFSDHYAHECQNIGYFELNNISYEIKEKK